MNNDRRKQIKLIIDRVSLLATQMESEKSALADLIEDIQDCENDEQEYYDNMPSGLQDGEKGERASDNVECLSTATAKLQELFDLIDEFASEVEEKLNEAIE